MKLNGIEVRSLADQLCAAEVPLIFHSGHAEELMARNAYPGALYCPKPSAPGEILQSVERQLRSEH
ncbi:hypothetical protein [Roseivivax sp. CAU 1761]